MAAVDGSGIATAPSQNPPFNLLDYGLVRPAGRTLVEAHLEHPEETDHSVEGIVPLRDSALNILSEAIREHDALGVSPPKERCPKLTPVTLVALAAERVLLSVHAPPSLKHGIRESDTGPSLA